MAVLADSPVIATGLSKLVRRTGIFDVVAATTVLEDVTDLVARDEVGVIVVSGSTPTMDLSLAVIRDTVEATGRAVGTVGILPAAGRVLRERVVGSSSVVTAEDGVQDLMRALFEARDHCRRPARATARIHRPEFARTPQESGRAALTPREIEVLQGLADGLSPQVIAVQLNVSVHTLRTHVQRVLPKLGVHTRLRAIAVALDEGIVEQRRTTQLAARYAASPQGPRSASTAG